MSQQTSFSGGSARGSDGGGAAAGGRAVSGAGGGATTAGTGGIKMRSDLTRPSSRSSMASAAAAGGGGSGSAGLLSGGASSGSLGAGGLSRQPSAGSTAAGRPGRQSIGSIQHAPAAGGGAGRPAGAATSSAARGASAAAAAAQPTTPGTGAGAGGAGATPKPYLQSNALFGNEHSSMTPSVRKAEYAPTLSPDLEQLAAGGGAPARARPAAAPEQQVAAQQQVQPGAPGLAAARRPAKTFLQTAGDLFAQPDQGAAEEPLVVDVCGSRLVSPGWNQSRPWLTGSWLMEYPPEFIAEVAGGGNPGDVAAAATAGSCKAAELPPLQNLAVLGAAEQEAALVDDLLTVFMGQAGEYVRRELLEGPKWPRLGLRVVGVADQSLAEQVERLLPLCECVYVVKRFVETRSRIEHPMVAQALAAAMRKLQEEWWLLVVQLEHQQLQGRLSLAALVYYCQAPAASMSLLASIAGEASDQASLTSAGLLNLLAARQRALAGDRPGQALVGQLLAAAAEPYFVLMRQWLCWGVLDDPYNEFMVKEDQDVGRDSLTPDGQPAYWTRRYRLRGAVGGGGGGGRRSAQGAAGAPAHDVPEFLESSKEAILVTGKYLNVIRQCGQPVPPCPQSTLDKLTYAPAGAHAAGAAAVAGCGYGGGYGGGGSPAFLSGIQEALEAAAGALLGLMAGPQGRLVSWLHCLKHLFLLDQGDLLVHLLEQPELHEPPSALAPHQLQGLLDAALRSSSVAASPHAEVVGEGVLGAVVDKRSMLQLVTAATCGLAEPGAADKPGGAEGGIFPRGAKSSYSCCLEMLLLTVKLSWPLTLVVSRKQLLHYQVIFKQLLGLKWAERDLGQLWQGMRATKRLSREDQARFRPWHLLCSQLLYVVEEVLRFTSIDVLEPLWGDMQAQLGQAGSMDAVICLHNAFLSAALERCLLTDGQVVKHISVLLTAAHTLSKDVAGGLADPAPAPPKGAGAGAAAAAAAQRSAAADSLRVMSSFCRDANRQAQLASLQARVDGVLQELVRDLSLHYHQLLSAAPAGPAAAAPGGGAAAAAAAGLGALALGGAAAGFGGAAPRGAVGDSSRELASLLNLIQRLELGCRVGGGGEKHEQLWPAAH